MGAYTKSIMLPPLLQLLPLRASTVPQCVKTRTRCRTLSSRATNHWTNSLACRRRPPPSAFFRLSFSHQAMPGGTRLRSTCNRPCLQSAPLLAIENAMCTGQSLSPVSHTPCYRKRDVLRTYGVRLRACIERVCVCAPRVAVFPFILRTCTYAYT